MTLSVCYSCHLVYWPLVFEHEPNTNCLGAEFHVVFLCHARFMSEVLPPSLCQELHNLFAWCGLASGLLELALGLGAPAVETGKQLISLQALNDPSSKLRFRVHVTITSAVCFEAGRLHRLPKSPKATVANGTSSRTTSPST